MTKKQNFFKAKYWKLSNFLSKLLKIWTRELGCEFRVCASLPNRLRNCESASSSPDSNPSLTRTRTQKGASTSSSPWWTPPPPPPTPTLPPSWLRRSTRSGWQPGWHRRTTAKWSPWVRKHSLFLLCVKSFQEYCPNLAGFPSYLAYQASILQQQQQQQSQRPRGQSPPTPPPNAGNLYNQQQPQQQQQQLFREYRIPPLWKRFAAE